MESDHETRPRKRLIGAGLAIGLLAGATAGVIMGSPIFASAQDGSSTSTTTTVVESTTTTPPAPADEPTEEATTTTTTNEVPTTSTPAGQADDQPAAADTVPGTPRKDRRAAWMKAGLQALVDNGTITQAQADAIIKSFTKMAEQFRSHHAGRPEGGPWGDRGKGFRADFGKGFGGEFGHSFKALQDAYTALNMSPAELGRELLDGKTLAEIARARGVDPQVLIDAALAPVTEQLDRAVANGRMSRAEADQRLAEATKAIGDAVNNGSLGPDAMPFLHQRPGG